MNLCPNCMQDFDKLHEGFCAKCHKKRKAEIEQFNDEYEVWNGLTEKQKIERFECRMIMAKTGNRIR